MSHLARFKVVYFQLAVAIASSVAGELGPMKEMTHEQLANLTWVAWAILCANVVVAGGNTIVASFHAVPAKTDAPASPFPQAATRNPDSFP